MSTTNVPSSQQHAELIDSLQELYVLLATLGAFPALGDDAGDPVQLPPHAPGSINAAAAAEAGYAPAAVELMRALPYLAAAADDYGNFEVLPSTKPITYLGGDLDEGDFEWRREMMAGSDEMMPPTALRLTRINIYGVEWIYDVETCLLTSWEPFDCPGDDYFGLPAQSPRQVLGPVIEKYQRLDYIARLDEYVDFSSPLFSESGGRPPKDWGPRDALVWEAQYAVWQAVRGIKDIYVECGWDVDKSVREQGEFRRGEFLQKRAEYWKRVVEPLVEQEEEAGRRRAEDN